MNLGERGKIKCSNCGLENKEGAIFCRNCGTPLNHNSNIKSQSNNNSSRTKKIVVICVTILICLVLIVGTLFFISYNNQNSASNLNESATNDSLNQTTDVDSDDGNDDVAVTDAKANSNSIKIISGEFYTGNKLSDKTYCDVYVGKEFAGTNLKIQIYYSRDGSTLNPGNIVPKTVNNDGYVSLRSANSFKYYPDHASITLYDAAGNVLDTKEVVMSASRGKQTF